MNFKNERLMMSKEETRKRAKELLNENQVDLITKYMFLEQQCNKQKEVIDRAINYIVKETKSMPTNGCKIRLIEILEILNEVKDDKKKEE